MKKYEGITRISVPDQSYILMRIDGNAFHTYTKKLKRPFDDGLIEDMNGTAAHLVEKVQNCIFAYVQSDEISLLIRVRDYLTSPWFDNDVQKMVSVTASLATSKFNHLRIVRAWNDGCLLNMERFVMAEFDARVWTLPNRQEVFNYFLWRQKDARRNAISAAAQSVFSAKELHGVSSAAKIEMLASKGIDWEDYHYGKKNGRLVEKVTYINGRPGRILDFVDHKGYFHYDSGEFPDGFSHRLLGTDVVRSKYDVVKTPVFSDEKEFINGRIPKEEL